MPAQRADRRQHRRPRKPGRLKRRAEFLRVAASGKKAAVGGVVLQALHRADDSCRLGSASP